MALKEAFADIGQKYGQQQYSWDVEMPKHPSDEEMFPSQPYGLPQDWDYKSADRGPQGEELPEGAVGWTPHGEVYFGPGLGGWWKELTHNMLEPVNSEAGREAFENVGPAFGKLFQGFDERGLEEATALEKIGAGFGTVFDGIGNFFEGLSHLGGEVDEETGIAGPTALTLVARAPKELANTVFGGFQAVADFAEMGLFGTQEGIRDIAEQSGIDELGIRPSDLLPFEDSPAGRWFEGFLDNIDLVNLAYDSYRALQAPLSYNEKKDILAENFQAGRIAYSNWVDASVKQEFIRRMRQGEDPYLLAEELQNPVAEMAGELIFDPMNYVGGFLGKFAKLNNFTGDASRFLTKVADPALAKTLSFADEISDAEATVRITNTVGDTMRWLGDVENATQTLADTEKLFGATVGARRAKVGQDMGTLFGWLAATVKEGGSVNYIEDTMRTVKSMVQMASGSADEVTEGLAHIAKFAGPKNPFFSEAGGQFAVVMKNMLTNADGSLNFKKFDNILAGVKELPEAEQMGALVEKLTPLIDDAVGGVFPTLQKRAKAVDEVAELVAKGEEVPADLQRLADAGEKLGPQAQLFMRAENLRSTPIMRGINSFFANIYMSYSPGYAFRNYANNALTGFVDTGTDAFLSSQKAASNMERVLGEVPAIANKDFGISGGGLASKQLGQDVLGIPGLDKFNASALSEKFEVAARTKLTWSGIKDSLWRMSDKALEPLDDVLTSFGISRKQGQKLLRSFDYDTNALKKYFTDAIEKQYVTQDNFLMMIPERDMKLFESLDMMDDLTELNKTVTTGEEAAEGIAKLLQEKLDVAKLAADEVTGIPPQYAGDAQALQLAQEGGNSRYVTDHIIELVNNRKTANIHAEQLLYDAVGQFVKRARKMLGDDVVDQVISSNPKWQEFISDGIRKAALDDTPGYRLYRQISDDLTTLPRNATYDDLARVWRKYSVPGDPPANLDRQMLRNAVWELSAHPQIRKHWADARDAHTLAGMELMEALARPMQGQVQPPDMRLFTQAQNAFADAVKWDYGVVEATSTSRKFYTVDPAKFNEMGQVTHLGIINGVPSATTSGIPNQHLLNAINKYLPEGTQKFTRLQDVPLDVARQSLNARSVDKGMDFNDLAHVAKKAADEAIDVTDEFAEVAGKADEVLTPALLDTGQAPTVPRMYYMAQDDLQAATRRLLDMVKKEYGKTANVPVDTALAKQIDDAMAQVTMRVQESKLVSRKVGEAYGDFGVLDYSQRKNAGTLAGLAMPYYYFGSRTPINWLKRIAYSPHMISGYAKYKDTLAEAHAGAPEWWKNNVNSAELLGLFPDNPLFFNLEATLNPLNSMLGPEYEDPYKRTTSTAAWIDDLGKIGPSLWTPINIAMALSFYLKGEEEAASRWGSRLIGQTRVAEAGASLLRSGIDQGQVAAKDQGIFPKLFGIDNPLAGLFGDKEMKWGGFGDNAASNLLDTLSFDPNIALFSGGEDPFTANRTVVALQTMQMEGIISMEQFVDAANSRHGEIWDAAKERAVNTRAPGQMMSFFLGVGFKGRTAAELQIEKFYGEYGKLWNERDAKSADQHRLDMDALFQQFPFGQGLLMARKSGPDRDSAFAYNILGRLPPGQSSLAQLAGLDPAIQSKFYESKGDLRDWSEGERLKFMGAITDMSAILAVPADATKQEWGQARAEYREMKQMVEQRITDVFGSAEGLSEATDLFWQIRNEQGQDAANAFLEANPQVEMAMSYQKMLTVADPTSMLTTYYGGLDQIESYWKGVMWDDIETQLGSDIWDKMDAYFATPKGERPYWNDVPEFKKYSELKDKWQGIVDQNVIEFASMLQEGQGVEIRQDIENITPGQELLINELQQPEDPLLSVTPEQWEEGLGMTNYMYIEEYLRSGEDIPDYVMDDLEEAAEEMGIDPGNIIQYIGVAMQRGQLVQ